jgi:prepilin-type N-terminal cleavage/methylation domain-containing protein
VGRLTNLGLAGRRLRRRLGTEDGFGIIELMIAIAILSIALFALLAGFVSGIATTRRAGYVATANALAGTQLDLYRALKYTDITLDSTALNSTDATYRSDAAIPGGIASEITSTCTGVPNQCNPSRTVTGPDHGSYRIDTYIVSNTPTSAGSSGRAVKLVTIVVRNASTNATYVRRVTAFDQSTGQ